MDPIRKPTYRNLENGVGAATNLKQYACLTPLRPRRWRRPPLRCKSMDISTISNMCYLIVMSAKNVHIAQGLLKKNKY